MLKRLAPVFFVTSLVLAFLVGVLWQKVSNLEKGRAPAQVANPNDTGTANPDGKLTSDQVQKIPPVTDQDHLRGSKEAQVFLIEYSDLECPFCERFHPTAKQALAEYQGKVAWVYRHFPLDSIHSRARSAANASECVANLGGNEAFWKFVDTIFSNQQKYLTDTGLVEAAVAAGVAKNSFSSCLKNKSFEKKVDSDYQGGSAAGVTGTPGTFILNKKGEAWLVPGAVPYESLKATIDEALK